MTGLKEALESRVYDPCDTCVIHPSWPEPRIPDFLSSVFQELLGNRTYPYRPQFLKPRPYSRQVLPLAQDCSHNGYRSCDRVRADAGWLTPLRLLLPRVLSCLFDAAPQGFC